MKFNWCCKLRTASIYYGEFSYFSIFLRVPSKLWRERIMWEYQEEKIPLKNEKLYFKDIRQNSVVSSIFQRTGFKVQQTNKNTKHHTWTTLIFSGLSIMVFFCFLFSPWMWNVVRSHWGPQWDLIWYPALRNNLYIFHSLHSIKIFLTATVTDLWWMKMLCEA